MLRWTSFAKQKSPFFIEEVSPESESGSLRSADKDKKTSTKCKDPYGLSLSFEGVKNWRLPEILKKGLDDGTSDVKVHLSLSLLNKQSLTFFGTTWVGASIPLVENSLDVVDLEYKEIVYIISRLIDPSSLGIIEIVATKYDKESQITLAQYGCGWASIDLFKQGGKYADISDGWEGIKATSIAFLDGSPRDMLDRRVRPDSFIHNDTTVEFKIYSHRKLLRISNFVKEDCIIDRFDVVPGLVLKEVTPTGSTRKKSLPCIGDREIFDEKHGDFIDIPGIPKVLESFKSIVSNCQLFMPDRMRHEQAILEGIHVKSKGEKRIQSRSIKIGFHNGHTFIGNTYSSHNLIVSKADDDVLTVSNQTIEVEGFVPHELVALVISVEYIISATELKHTVPVTIGASVFIPLRDGKIFLKDNQFNETDATMFSIQLDVANAEVCEAIISDRCVGTSSSFKTPRLGFDIKMSDNKGKSILHGQEIISNGTVVDKVDFGDTERSFVGSDIDSLPCAVVQGDTFRTSFSRDLTQTLRPSDFIDGKEPFGSRISFNDEMRTSSVLGEDELTSEYDNKVAYDVLPNVKEYSRQLTRGAVSKLTRHGFNAKYGMTKEGEVHHHIDDLDVDIIAEARDSLSVNEVTIQFAGFRTDTNVYVSNNLRAIHCNYQFYTSGSVWTENFRILPSERGEISILMRDEVKSRNENPPVYRHVVNCADLTTDEADDFAEYLHNKILYVDVWDADSLHLLGTCSIPLRPLMRQGQSSVKYAVECDIIDANASRQMHDGISTIDIVSNGPAIGVIVGSLNIIMNNTGKAGNAPLNGAVGGNDYDHRSRAKNHTRAKALKDSEPALSRALNDQLTNRNNTSTWKENADGNAALKYDDLVRLFKRFPGSIKGTVLYHGSLLNLLEVPTTKSAISNLMKVMKAARNRGVNIGDIANSLCDGEGNVSYSQLKEFLTQIASSVHLSLSAAEVAIIANKYSSSVNYLHVSRLLDLIQEDMIRLEWSIVASRFKSALQVAMSSGIDLNRIFVEYDADLDGHISVQGFKSILQSLSSFTNFTSAEVSNVVSYFSRRSRDGQVDMKNSISVRAIFAYLGTEYNADVNNFSQGDKMVEIFAKAVEKGLSLEDIFVELDNDQDGHLTSKELQDGLRNLGNFDDFSIADGDEFVSQFDHSDDKISKEDFIDYFDSKINHLNLYANAGKTEATRIRVDDIVAKFKMLMYQAAKTGTSEELFFSYLDSNHNDRVSFQELDDGLTRFSSFTRLSYDEIQTLVMLYDDNFDGDISLTEFQKFSRSVNLTRRALRHHLRRIAEPDGGIAGLLAFLDGDNDGFVSSEAFLSMCSREAVFEMLSKRDCEALISPICNSGNISCPLLLKLIEDDTFDPFDSTKETVDDADIAGLIHEKAEDGPYKFDSDPELRATEKKIRSISRTLINSGFDMEGLFRQYDSRNCGMIRRSDFIEVLTRAGLYVPDGGRYFDLNDGYDDVTKLQQLQIDKLKNISTTVVKSDMRGRLIERGEIKKDLKPTVEFQDYKESVALVNSYREGQKQLMLQKVLSHSFSSSLEIYPRFGKTLFFELPVKNPFNYEETFFIESSDPEMKIVVNFDEWIHLRQTMRPCSKIGEEPFDANIFQRIDDGRVGFSMLPDETMYIPFTFCSLSPLVENQNVDPYLDRVIEARVLSSSYDVMNVFKINVYPRPNRITRNLYLYETENTIFKKRINILSDDGRSSVKYTHCIELSKEHRVVIEQEKKSGSSLHTQILLRYRCPQYPTNGNFYVLVYDDEYQAVLSEIWLVIVQSKLKLDVSTPAGTSSSLDLVVRGDRYGRRVKIFSNASSRLISFNPSTVMQMTAGVFNRIVANMCPSNVGKSKLLINLVDVDSLQLVSSWLLNVSATPPMVMRQYQVLLDRSKFTFKKISFQNPWDISRRFQLTSSDDTLMKPRDESLDVLPRGTGG